MMRALVALALAAAAAAAAWWTAALWQFGHPQAAPTVLTDTAPAVGALLLGALTLLLSAWAPLRRAPRRGTAAALGLVGLLAAAGPAWVVADTVATLNDWNFANRTFLAAYLPAAALAMDGSLTRVDRVPHYEIHHAFPLPRWEVSDLERQWNRLRALTGSRPRNGITLYLNDADVDPLGIGHHGAAYGSLVIARPLTLVDPCQGGMLHEIAHAFMYTQSRGNIFPQLLDEGWAVANQGCPQRTLDERVLADAEQGLMPPLEDRLTRSGFRDARYGGIDTGYDAGGSWVAWLLQRYGAPRFMAFINSSTPGSCLTRAQAVYGIRFSVLEHAWLAHIARELGAPALDFSRAGSVPDRTGG
jgi:hypothetical protein